MSVATIFGELENRIKENPALVKQIGGVFIWKIEGETWVLNLKDGPGTVSKGDPGKVSGSVTITLGSADFVQLMMGKLDANTAWASGKLQLDGNMALALKLQTLVKSSGAKL